MSKMPIVNDTMYQLKLNNPDLKLAEIEGLLYVLQRLPGISSGELIRTCGLPKETLRKFKASISQYLKDHDSDSLELNDLGQKAVKEINPQEYSWSLVSYTDQDAQKQLEEIRAKHGLDYSEAKREYDQFFATSQTSVAKVMAMANKGQVKDKNIAILGDDDLVALTLFLLESKVGQAKKITVFEIDQDIIKTLQDVISEKNIKNIEVVQYDARNDLKPQYLGIYDVFMTDPAYTPAGVNLFISRGLQLLKPSKNESGPYFYLHVGHSIKEPEKTLKIQEILQKCNLLIEDKIDRFNRYYGAESIGSTSSLYILKVNKHTRANQDYQGAQIYTHEANATADFPYVDHFVFKLYNVPGQIVGSKKAMQKSIGAFMAKHRLKVVDTKMTRFKGGGLTMTYVLAQSNLVVHTWPEKNALHIDLITCSPVYDTGNFANNLATLFKTDFVEVTQVE